MKIMILTVGSQGDVQPFVALGVGLQRAGHDVIICTSHNFKSFVQGYGLQYAYMNADLIALTETPEGRAAVEGGGNPLKLMNQVKPMIRQMLDDAWAAAQAVQPAVILYHPKTLGAPHIIEKLGIPGLMSLALPLYTPTREFPFIMMSGMRLGGWFNRLSYKLVPLISAPYRGVVNAWRQAVLGLPKRSQLAREWPTLYAYSPHVVPPPADWPPTAVTTGYWFLPPQTGWQPPVDLTAFLEAGPPPVYVGFGSMVGKRPQQLAHIVVEALQKTGQRGLIATGWGGLQPGDLPQSIFMMEGVPHDWLFPQMAAVVHHGGSGTTAAGLRAGKPTLICPFLGDQPFWGQRVFDLGVGPRPIPQKKMTVDNLAAAIKTAVTDQTMQARAAALGAKIQAEDGIARAIEFIQSQMANQS